MATLLLLWTACLLYSGRIQGSSAASRVFVLKGEDVRLDVQKPDLLRGVIHFFSWTFKSKYPVVTLSSKSEPTVHKNYTRRVELPIRNYSLRLKNLQEADSGVYTAEMIGDEKHTVAEYNVTVQERVSPAVLTVGSVPSSSDSCNLTVTCSAQDSSISSTVTCDNQTCSQEGGERSEVTTSAASLYVYLSNASIICNHSNQVSWSEDMKKIKPLCQANQVSDQNPDDSCVIKIVVPVLGIVLLVLLVLLVFLLRRRKSGTYERENTENTVYDTAQHPNRDQFVNQNHTADTSVPSETTTYSLIGLHTAPMGPTETRGSNLPPESVYATVAKPARP
ncbi:uncharacterized protein LOC139928909 [Centroberyx gerrardi]